MKPGFLFYKVKVNLNAPDFDSFHYCKHQKLLIFSSGLSEIHISFIPSTPLFSFPGVSEVQ